MNRQDLTRLSTDELWKIHEVVAEILASRILIEKQALDSKLSLLQQKGFSHNESSAPKSAGKREKRKYAKVLQKYRNPQDHSQTWSGRGKQPHWVAKLLKSGLKLDDLIIPQYRKMMKKAA
ncbi:H-NS histone family protein [Bradyrhizobium sp. LHD-71]|uniref:H-NS histone family protein n=1 Tax=Bradyrhizobium sp. LHD-71 TaxID=3072141 RepID=UPI00280F0421|nr:H-NS histone family protein [Bradyrhizobium sp. LHD-71]MDQ8727670.1 H-NS histone family protein [Bradyrhizobium sp. LHD-71]